MTTTMVADKDFEGKQSLCSRNYSSFPVASQPLNKRINTLVASFPNTIVGTDCYDLLTKGENKNTQDKITEFIASTEHAFCRIGNNLKSMSALNKMIQG